MSHKNDSIMGIASAVLIAVMLSPIIFAGEPQKTTDSISVAELKALASNGDVDAMLQLGEKLIPEQGTDSGGTEALQWLQKAANAGGLQAWYDLGFMYANSAGVEADVQRAVDYWHTGAEKGNADCQASVGLVYQAGERIAPGVKADPKEAVKWYKLAAEQGHTEAIQHLAMMNSRGMGIEQDHSEAIKWFRKGAELGSADCKWGLGQCYLNGMGVKQDTVLAYALFSASLDGVENPEQRKAMTERRDKLGKSMTTEQVRMAEPLIQEWTVRGKK